MTTTSRGECIRLCEANIAISSQKDMYLKWETVGEGKRGRGGKGRGKGGSVYSQPGIRVDGDSRHVTKEGFPSKGKFKG